MSVSVCLSADFCGCKSLQPAGQHSADEAVANSVWPDCSVHNIFPSALCRYH